MKLPLLVHLGRYGTWLDGNGALTTLRSKAIKLTAESARKVLAIPNGWDHPFHGLSMRELPKRERRDPLSAEAEAAFVALMRAQEASRCAAAAEYRACEAERSAVYARATAVKLRADAERLKGEAGSPPPAADTHATATKRQGR